MTKIGPRSELPVASFPSEFEFAEVGARSELPVASFPSGFELAEDGARSELPVVPLPSGFAEVGARSELPVVSFPSGFELLVVPFDSVTASEVDCTFCFVGSDKSLSAGDCAFNLIGFDAHLSAGDVVSACNFFGSDAQFSTYTFPSTRSESMRSYPLVPFQGTC